MATGGNTGNSARSIDDKGTELKSPRTVLAAKSIAIVGASERGRWPKQIFNNLRTRGYQGDVYLVNPRQREVYGERCYPSLRDLPAAVEHAAVIVPSAFVPGVLEDAEARGVKSATIYAAGIGDGDDPESRKRGAWLKDFLARTSMRISGPNCMGAFSYRERLFAYPHGALCDLEPGPVGVVFQSGGNLQFFMQAGGARGLRFSYAISTGNEPDLDLADYVNYLTDDPHTKSMVLFIEGIRRPYPFMQAAGRALEAGKPIVAIKTGRSRLAQQAALSHTGAIAGDYAAFQAMCERYGIVTCRSMDDMLEAALAFQCDRRPKGPKIGFVTTSGGTVDLLFDYTEQEGAPLATFSDATNAALLPTMQEGIAPKNPLDVGIPSTAEVAAQWCRIVHDEPDVDMVAFATNVPRPVEGYGDVSPFLKLMGETEKPILGFGRMIHQSPVDLLEAQRAFGFPLLQGLEPTVRALQGLWFHAERQGRKPAEVPPPAATTLTSATLDEQLARYGIALPRSRIAATPGEAAAAAAEIGFPVVLKIQSADILHKTEAGGVLLDLKSPQAVDAGAKELMASAAKAYPNASIDGFLVQEMVSGVEAIVGARNDALYGPMMLIGAGGILVELANDAKLSMLPVSDRDVAAMIGGLKLSKLLAGYRGRPAADRAAMEKAVSGLARFFLDHRTAIADIEINPLIVRPDGKGAVAVDVRVIWN
ncbi:MAG: acetate--CoA ligase family protein [Hyphomicrobiaceae bacterium]